MMAGTALVTPFWTVSPLLIVKATRMSFHMSSGSDRSSGTR